MKDKKLRVLHVINTLSAGGAELHLLTLSKYLQRLGVDVAVAYLKDVPSSRPLRADFEAEGIPVFDLTDVGLIWPFSVFSLRRMLREEKPDILHSHLPRADFLCFLSHSVEPSSTWVCSVHDIHSKSWRARRALPLYRFIWGKSDLIIAISDAVKDWLVSEFHLPERKVYVVHYGLELGKFESPSADFRALHKLSSGPLIGSIGRLEPRKGFDILIQAMAIVTTEVPDVTLLIAGHDPWGYGKVIKGLINRFGLDREIRLIGFQNDIPSLLHALDIFAFASRSEGFGQVVIEAMAAGKPVVANKIPPMTEIVRDGETGLLVEAENPEALARAIIWLLRHPEEAKQMGSRGAEYVKREFSAERMAHEILSLYEKTIEGMRYKM